MNTIVAHLLLICRKKLWSICLVIRSKFVRKMMICKRLGHWNLKLLLLLSRFDTFDLFMFILSMLIILLSRNQLVEINLFAVSIFGWILFLILRISFLDCRCRDGIRIFVDGCWSCSLCNEDESEGSFLGDEFSNLRRWHFVRNSFLDKKKLHFIKTVFFRCQYIIRMLNLLLKMGAWI